MRASITLQSLSTEQVKRQKPSTHCWFVPHADVSVALQIAFGRVSGTHAPALQYLPSPHWASPVHAAVHDPATHFGVPPLQLASLVHCACVGSGSHTPFVQVLPAPQSLGCVHVFTHWPFAHDWPVAHSLEYLHTSAGGVQTPPAHWSPFEQSAFALHGHGPFVPPHVWHLFATQIWLCPVQSVLVVHSFGVVVVEPGAAHRPWLQTVPLSHSVSTVHVF